MRCTVCIGLLSLSPLGIPALAQESRLPVSIEAQAIEPDTPDSIVVINSRVAGVVVLLDFLPGHGFARRSAALGPFAPGRHEVIASPSRIIRQLSGRSQGWPPSESIYFQAWYQPIIELSDGFVTRLPPYPGQDFGFSRPGPPSNADPFPRVRARSFVILFAQEPDLAALDRLLLSLRNAPYPESALDRLARKSATGSLHGFLGWGGVAP